MFELTKVLEIRDIFLTMRLKKGRVIECLSHLESIHAYSIKNHCECDNQFVIIKQVRELEKRIIDDVENVEDNRDLVLVDDIRFEILLRAFLNDIGLQ